MHFDRAAIQQQAFRNSGRAVATSRKPAESTMQLAVLFCGEGVVTSACRWKFLGVAPASTSNIKKIRLTKNNFLRLFLLGLVTAPNMHVLALETTSSLVVTVTLFESTSTVILTLRRLTAVFNAIGCGVKDLVQPRYCSALLVAVESQIFESQTNVRLSKKKICTQ
jgi:hypothetical protein